MSVRPIYQSSRDLRNEQSVADLLAKRWRLSETLKLSFAYGLDFCLIRSGNAVAFAEIKCRKLSFGFGDGYYISCLKALEAHRLAARFGVPCLLVVRFDDGSIHWANFEDAFGCFPFGRVDRADDFDREPCCRFPWSCFKEVA